MDLRCLAMSGVSSLSSIQLYSDLLGNDMSIEEKPLQSLFSHSICRGRLNQLDSLRAQEPRPQRPV